MVVVLPGFAYTGWMALGTAWLEPCLYGKEEVKAQEGESEEQEQVWVTRAGWCWGTVGSAAENPIFLELMVPLGVGKWDNRKNLL